MTTGGGAIAPRQRVLDVASELFAARGLDDVTMAEVAEAAGVARATVFNHFGSKHALVEAITASVLVRYGELLDRALDDDDATTGDLVRRLFEEMGKGIESERRFFRSVFREITRIQLGLDEGRLAAEARRETATRLVELVARGQRRGDVTDELSAETVAAACGSLANGTITGWLYQDDAAPLVERMREAAEVLLTSVERPPRARRRRRTAGAPR
jgi:AcrR family transcriptional regulator